MRISDFARTTDEMIEWRYWHGWMVTSRIQDRVRVQDLRLLAFAHAHAKDLLCVYFTSLHDTPFDGELYRRHIAR